MECSHESSEDAVIVAVRGRVDESSWAEFGTGLSEAIGQARQLGLNKLIIDLTELAYMSSRGLRVLTMAKREGEEDGIAVALACPNDVMREILEISRYDKLFIITDTIEAARK
jgi:anti-anti-sigma factor